MEPLLQVLAAADSTVREGLNAQVQALADERAALEAEWAQLAADRTRVDEGRRAVDDMVEVGRKMHQAQLAEIQAREETLDSVMRETEEERQAALIASSVLDEAVTTGNNPTGVPYVRALFLVPGGKVHQKLVQFRV